MTEDEREKLAHLEHAAEFTTALQQLEITMKPGPHVVEVQIREDRTVLWVSINNETVLRIGGIDPNRLRILHNEYSL